MHWIRADNLTILPHQNWTRSSSIASTRVVNKEKLMMNDDGTRKDAILRSNETIDDADITDMKDYISKCRHS